MKCEKCGRDNLSERELEVHLKYYHMQDNNQQRISAGVCPDCRGDLWHESGCISCHSCGYSKC
jgi:hypothetical protein